ncbi:PREDICTED: F-box/kelch-repeat protein At1g57790-like [Fragaria vesca subsp. vesca]
MISGWVRAVVEKSQTISSKLLLLSLPSRLQPRTTSQEEQEGGGGEEEEEWRCFNSYTNNNWMQMADNKQSCWSDLPSDILCEVVNRLPYWDLIRSAAVCKTWRLVIHKVHLPQRSTLLVPYLMSYTCILDGKHIHRSTKNPVELEISHKSKNSVEFLDMEGETYKYTVRDLDRTEPGPCESKYGWFLLYRRQFLYVRKQYYYLYNPFCNEVIQLPGLDLEMELYVDIATFTTPPTSPNFVIFVLCKKYRHNTDRIIYTCKLGDTRWSICRTRYHGSVTGVTCVDGIVYCTFPQKNFSNGSTSVFICTFDIALQNWVMNYTYIEIEDHNESRTFYLVESIDGKLLLAVSDLAHDASSHYWFLYQFDRSRKEWTRIRSLGHQVLLLSSSTSIACATLGKDSKFSDMIFHLSWGREPFTLSSDGVWRKP